MKDKEISKVNGFVNKENKSNILNNSNSDKKEYIYKEFLKMGVSIINSVVIGILIIIVGIVFILVCKFRKI